MKVDRILYAESVFDFRPARVALCRLMRAACGIGQRSWHWNVSWHFWRGSKYWLERVWSAPTATALTWRVASVPGWIWLLNPTNWSFKVRYFLLDHKCHLVSQIKNSQDGTPGRCWCRQQLILLPPGSPATPTKRTGPQEQKLQSSQPSVFSSLSEAALG